MRISKGFQSFDHEPLASASLGQVHRAVLRNGREVAVKVQRPGVREQVAADMDVIEELAEFLDDHTKTGRRFGFAGMVDEFRTAITAELDYLAEADNLRTMGELLSDYEHIVVPQPVNDYTTSTVLTMDTSPAATCRWWVRSRSSTSTATSWRSSCSARTSTRSWCTASCTPIRTPATSCSRPTIGSRSSISAWSRASVRRCRTSCCGCSSPSATARAARVAAVMAGIAEHTDEYDSATFERRIVDLVQRNQTVTMSNLDAGVVVGELTQIAGECGLRPPSELTMLGKALLNLDQVAAKLAPNFDPNAAIREHVGEVMRHKMLQAASPGNLLSAAMDAKEFAELLPSRVNKVMDALARGELTLNVQGIDERELMRGIQKLANRVTTGVIIAALVIGGAMIMRVDTDVKVFGYSAVAVVMLAVAAIAGVWLIVTSLRNDVPHDPDVRNPRRRSS